MLLLIWIAILSLGLGLLLFGGGDLIVLKSDSLVFLQGDDVLWRFFGAFGIAFISLILVATFSFMCSIFTENSIGPIVATMSFIVFFTILSTLNIPIFNVLKPYLFTTHLISWKEFFDLKVNDANEAIIGSIQNPQRIITSALVLLLHIVGFVGGAIFIFNKKDVLS